jgi:hypothetical protein
VCVPVVLALAGWSAWRAVSRRVRRWLLLDRLQLAAANPRMDALDAVAGDLVAPKTTSSLPAAQRLSCSWRPRSGGCRAPTLRGVWSCIT